MAHEVSSIVPEAVTGTKDAVEVWKDDEELPKGVSVADNKLDAIQDLNRLHGVIGQNHYELLEYVCGFGNTIKQMNSKFKLSKRRGGHKFREALDEASIFYGLRDKGNTIRGNKKR